MKTIIKPVPGQDGYFVSNDGNVYTQWINKGKHGLVKGSDLIMLKGSKSMGRYKTIRFGRKGKVVAVHRLVYETFIGEIPKGMVIRHLNDNPEDNHIGNLAIGTHKDNMADAISNGIFPRGSKNGISKLTEKDVKEIRDINKTYTQENIAKMYGVSRRTIGMILKNEIWKHVN